MPTPARPLEALVTAFLDGELKLPALFDALGERGPVSADQHARDVAWLEHLRDDTGLDARIVQALLGKLDDVQASAQPSPPAAAVGDKAVTRVVTGGGHAGSADEEATLVRPASGPDDGTVVHPGAPAGGADEAATVVHPPSSPGAGDTHTQGTTGTTSSLNTSTWERVAGAAGGEYASVGTLLKGRFLLEKELGRGGMGIVYLARDERKVEARDRDPYVAVKVLNDEFRRHPDSLIALQRESRRSQQLAHDNIVRVYDFDKDGTIVFMTMEYIDGSSLKALIREQAYNGMPLARARPLIEGMCWALKRAHGAGVVHSDFKPGNVMVTREGVPKVFDFGIARAGKHLGKADGEVAGEQTVFDAGTLGALTPAYASLEMLRGGEPTPADDIYALGCVCYELLTGKHPFDKVSAEVALKEGREPPEIHGLTKRQNQTLRRAVAFHGADRLQNVTDLIEGLRTIGWGERARPFLIYGALGLIVVVGGGFAIHDYLGRHAVATVVARFNPGNADHYRDENQALKALDGLGPETGKRVVSDDGGVIEAYLLARLAGYWDPARKRYDYAGVQNVFRIRDELKLFSPRLDAQKAAIQQQRNALLNTLDTELSRRIAAGAIFENQPDNVVGVLDTIRAVDPTSQLLDNTELELKYDVAIGQSLAAGKVDEAKARVALATRLFPKSKRLAARAQQLAALESANAAAARVAATEQTVPQARAALAGLIAKPALSPEWVAAVTGTVRVLKADHAPETGKLFESLAKVIASEAAGATQPLDVQRASDLVALALSYQPHAPALLAQQKRLGALQQQAQAQLAAESATAEIASRIESLKRAAAAHDIAKATESLNRIRTLQPTNPFLATQGPQLLAQAYLGQADALVGQGAYQRAANLLAQGLQAAGNVPELRNAHARDVFAVAALAAAKQPPDAAGIQKLRDQLAALRRADAKGLQALEASLKQHGALPQGSFSALLDGLKPASTTTPTSAAPASAPVTSAPASAPAVASAPTTPATPAAAAPDPCAREGLAGHGRICLDTLEGGGRGPALVVIPGAGGGKPFALSRTDITVAEFNRFCAAAHQCAAKGGVANLPVTNVSLAEAQAYAAWLSKASGYTYRLPTGAEWLHAAKAGQNWSQSPDSNCIPPSGGADGAGGPISALGRQPNPWGLVNMSGNVWEWVVSGGSVAVRGGSYNSYWSDCTVNAERSDSGKPQADVGFRLLRELK